MNNSVQQPVKTRKRRWAEMALGVASGLMLGLPLLAYTGIRKLSGNKLPAISSDIKKGAAVGLAAAVSMFATIFSGGFAAPAVPAIVSGVLTCAAGIGGVVLVEKRAEKQQHAIQELQEKVDQLNAKQQNVAQVQQVSQALGKTTQKQTAQGVATSKSSQGQSKATVKSASVPQKPKFKVKKTQVQKQIAAIVADETRKARAGSTEEFSPSSTSAKSRTVSKGEAK
jgi:hypothetical protein